MTRTRAELKLAAGHFGYELDQFAAMPSAIVHARDDERLAVACLESMLVHARNLVDFLVLPRQKKGDIHRSDFLDKWSPEKSPASRRLRKFRPKINQHLSHLTWRRVEVGNPKHYPDDLGDDVLFVMKQFAAELRKQNPEASEWFRSSAILSDRRVGIGRPNLSFTTSSVEDSPIIISGADFRNRAD